VRLQSLAQHDKCKRNGPRIGIRRLHSLKPFSQKAHEIGVSSRKNLIHCCIHRCLILAARLEEQVMKYLSKPSKDWQATAATNNAVAEPQIRWHSLDGASGCVGKFAQERSQSRNPSELMARSALNY
jgi:hypothetical protein